MLTRADFAFRCCFHSLVIPRASYLRSADFAVCCHIYASVKQVKAEYDAVAALHASALDEVQLLPGFIRLLDCLVLQNHLDLIISAVEGVQAHLQREGVYANVEIAFGNEGPVFNPPQDEFLKVSSWGSWGDGGLGGGGVRSGWVGGSVRGPGWAEFRWVRLVHLNELWWPQNHPTVVSSYWHRVTSLLAFHLCIIDPQAMGRSVVESLVSVIKEVPNPSKHPALAPLLLLTANKPPRGTSTGATDALGKTAAAAAASAGRRDSGRAAGVAQGAALSLTGDPASVMPSVSEVLASSGATGGWGPGAGFAFVSIPGGAGAAARGSSSGGGLTGQSVRLSTASAASFGSYGRLSSSMPGLVASTVQGGSGSVSRSGGGGGLVIPGHQITMMAVGDATLAQLRRSCDIIIMRSYREAGRLAEMLGELDTLFR